MLRPAKEGRGPREIPARTWTGLALIAAALSVVFGGDLGRWVGCGLIVAVAPDLLGPLAQLPAWQRAQPKLKRALPLALVVALALVLLGQLALGHPPITRDHGVHFFQTRVLVDELIPRGRLHGWSESLNSGYPFGDSYPVLGYLFTGAAHLLSFGLISLRTSYAWGLLAVWAIALGAVWWLAQLIAQELRGDPVEPPPADQDPDPDPDPGDPARAWIDPRWAGAIAAIAYLIDPGASREGGWNYLMFHGVWPQFLSSALWIASLPATWSALRRPSPRAIAFASLLLGGSVLAHPFGMLSAAASALAWPIVLWASGALRELPDGQVRWWALIHTLAVLVCLGWVVIFLSSAGSMARSPVPWKSLGALTAELMAGELFRDYRAWIGPLTVVGLIATIRRGRALGWLGLGLICALMVLASEASITVLRLDLLVSSFKNLQFPRYSIALKPLLYVFAGVGGALLIARLRALPRRDHPARSAAAPRPAAARLIAALCLAPLLVGLLESGDRLVPEPVGVKVFAGSAHAEVDRELAEALAAEARDMAAADDPRPLTVAFLRRGMGGGTYVLYAITDAGADLVMDGHIPAVNYKYQVRRRNPNTLRAMGVTHVVYDRRLGGNADDTRLYQELERVGRFGTWTLARLRPGKLEHYFRIQGSIDPDALTIERIEPQGWRVTVAESERESGVGRVELPVGPYRKWYGHRVSGEAPELEPKPKLSAGAGAGEGDEDAGDEDAGDEDAGDEDGELSEWAAALEDAPGGPYVQLEPAQLGRGIPAISIPFGGPGVVELRYHTPALETKFGLLSLAVVVLLLLALLSSRELELAGRLESPRTIQISWALGLLSFALLLGLVYQRQQRQLRATWADVIDDHTNSGRILGSRALRLREDLVDTRAFSVTYSNPDGCDSVLGKDALAGCTQDDADARATMLYRSPYLYRCVRVKLPPRSSATIELPGLREGDDLAGFFTRQDRDMDGIALELPGEVEFLAAGNNKRQHFHVLAEQRGGETSLKVRNEAMHERRLCFALAALEPAED